jgi:hypothetical protein
MLKLGKLFGGNLEPFEHILPAELADLRGQVKVIGRFNRAPRRSRAATAA